LSGKPVRALEPDRTPNAEVLCLAPLLDRVRLIRVTIRFLLPIALAFPLACTPPPSVPKAASIGQPSEAPTPDEPIRSRRPRVWDRLLVGLTRLPRRPYLTAKLAGGGRIVDGESGRLLGSAGAGVPLMLSVGSGDMVRFETRGSAGSAGVLRLEPRGGGLRLEGRSHTGALLCWRGGDQVVCVLEAPLETYLRGVLPGEVPSSWPMEAQKALAVAARTYAQASRGKHEDEGFDLCDGTHCQMYLGRVAGAARSERAVLETRGLVALSGGRLIRAFYSADCGGSTANNEDVPFPDNPVEPQPHLRSVLDAPGPGRPHYCGRSSHHRWTRLLTAEQIETALNADPETAIGALRSLRVSAVDGSGRAKTVLLEGLADPSVGTRAVEGGETLGRAAAAPRAGAAAPEILPPSLQPELVTREMPAYAFRRAIGPRRLKSTMFRIEPLSPTQFRLTGGGYGHGVGLCQIGARGMASAPYRRTFRQILSHYYRGVKVVPFRPAGEPP
jgi:stage II sporulation protein D